MPDIAMEFDLKKEPTRYLGFELLEVIQYRESAKVWIAFLIERWYIS